LVGSFPATSCRSDKITARAYSEGLCSAVRYEGGKLSSAGFTGVFVVLSFDQSGGCQPVTPGNKRVLTGAAPAVYTPGPLRLFFLIPPFSYLFLIFSL